MVYNIAAWSRNTVPELLKVTKIESESVLRIVDYAVEDRQCITLMNSARCDVECGHYFIGPVAGILEIIAATGGEQQTDRDRYDGFMQHSVHHVGLEHS